MESFKKFEKALVLICFLSSSFALNAMSNANCISEPLQAQRAQAVIARNMLRPPVLNFQPARPITITPFLKKVPSLSKLCARSIVGNRVPFRGFLGLPSSIERFLIVEKFGDGNINEAVRRLCLFGDTGLVINLVENGSANVNSANAFGETPLMRASYSGNDSLVRFLISRDASLDAQEDWHGRTALMIAVMENKRRVVEFLISAGANLNILDHEGNNAIFFAQKRSNQEIQEILEKAGAIHSPIS